jgi:Ca-activated chloride channel homolog
MAFCTSGSIAQTNRLIQEGNKLYEEQRYKDAASNYQKALAKDPSNYSGLFNLSNSLYQQKQYDSSRKFLASSEKNMKDKNAKSAMNYNIGNSYMAQQKYEDAVKSYKQTLRNNPNDVDAKYNLSYAEQMLKKQQQQNKDQKQNQDQKKQQQKQDQQKQDQKKNEKNDQKQPKPSDNQDKKDEQQQPQGGQAGNLSQQQADQLLNALQQQEKKLQDKLKKEKGANTRLEKDW